MSKNLKSKKLYYIIVHSLAIKQDSSLHDSEMSGLAYVALLTFIEGIYQK